MSARVDYSDPNVLSRLPYAKLEEMERDGALTGEEWLPVSQELERRRVLRDTSVWPPMRPEEARLVGLNGILGIFRIVAVLGVIGSLGQALIALGDRNSVIALSSLAGAVAFGYGSYLVEKRIPRAVQYWRALLLVIVALLVFGLFGEGRTYASRSNTGSAARLLWAIVWLLYWFNSRRVALTFAPKKVGHRDGQASQRKERIADARASLSSDGPTSVLSALRPTDGATSVGDDVDGVGGERSGSGAGVASSETLPVRNEAERIERDCPYCAERVLVKAKLCKHCGHKLVGLPGDRGHEPRDRTLRKQIIFWIGTVSVLITVLIMVVARERAARPAPTEGETSAASILGTADPEGLLRLQRIYTALAKESDNLTRSLATYDSLLGHAPKPVVLLGDSSLELPTFEFATQPGWAGMSDKTLVAWAQAVDAIASRLPDTYCAELSSPQPSSEASDAARQQLILADSTTQAAFVLGYLEAVIAERERQPEYRVSNAAGKRAVNDFVAMLGESDRARFYQVVTPHQRTPEEDCWALHAIYGKAPILLPPQTAARLVRFVHE